MSGDHEALPVVGEWLEVVRSEVHDLGLVVVLERDSGDTHRRPGNTHIRLR